MTTRAALMAEAGTQLVAAGIADGAREARLLMRWAAGLDGAALAAAPGVPSDEAEARRFRDAVTRRAGRMPLSHITGRRAFWGREFAVTPDVLDPRPETEVLVAEALQSGPFRRILDLGTGSGCILLSLLAEWPEAIGEGTDLSPAALAVAGANARTLGVADRATFRAGSWFAAADGAYDLIVSNPPYIGASELADLAPELCHEPHGALSPGEDALAAYREIASGARAHLTPDGLILVEIGATQGEPVAALLARSGLRVCGIVPDLDRRARVVAARR